MAFNIGDVTVGVRIDQQSVGRGLSMLGKVTTAFGAANQAAQGAAAAAALVPAALAASAAVGGTAALALTGVGSALEGYSKEAEKAASTGNAYVDAMNKLAPAAQDVVRSLVAAKPAFRDMKLEVQQRALAGLGGEIKTLAGVYLPVMQTRLGGIGTALNGAAKDFAGFLREGQSVADTNTGLLNTQQMVENMRPGFVNLAAVFRDFAAVGSGFLPGMGSGFTNLTARVREFVAQARETGQLRMFIQGGIDTLQQLGRIAGNVGGILGAVFGSASTSAGDFLGSVERVTEQVEAFLQSGQGRSAMLDIFGNIHAAVLELGVGMEGAGTYFVEALVRISSVLPPVAAAFASVASAALPFFQVMGTVSAAVLPVVADAVAFVTDNLGFLIPVALAAVTAVRGIALWGAYSAGVSALAGTIGLLGTALTGSMAAGAAMAGWATAIGRALPLVGIAAIGLTVAFDAMNTSASEAASALAQGGVAADQASAALAEQDAHLARIKGQMPGFLFEMQKWIETNVLGSASSADAAAEVARQRAEMTGLQRAQQDVTIAQGNYQAAVDQFTANSPQAIAAQQALAAAVNAEERAQQAAKTASQDHTDALRAQQAQMLGMADAELAMRQSIYELEKAEKAAAAAVRDHGAASDEAKEAGFRLEGAQNRVTEAGQRLAQQQGEGKTQTDQSRLANDAFSTSQLYLAATLGNQASPAVQKFARDMTSAELQAHNAAVQTSGLDFEVRKLPDGRSVNITTPGALEARTMMQGLQKDILNINGKTVDIFVTATGKGGIFSAGRLADGGILPGYTPGRDIHPALLSGGEAVIRPEGTRALGAPWINGINRAAKAGGVSGVKQYMAQFGKPGEYADGGIVALRTQARVNVNPQAMVDGLGEKARALGAKQFSAGAVGGALGGAGGGAGYQWQMAVLRSRFPGLPLTSGFRPGAITATGNRSYHSMGRAVDVPPRMDVFNWIRATYGARTKELIYSPAGGAQVHNGRPHVYTGVTRANHFDHVHWAFDKGGLADGPGYMAKGTIQPERVLSPRQTSSFERLVDVLDRVDRGGPPGGGGGIHIQNLTVQANNPDEFVSALQQTARRGSRKRSA